jgi:hypothetical protein
MIALRSAALRAPLTAALRPLRHRVVTTARACAAAPAPLARSTQLGARRALRAVPLPALAAATRRDAGRRVRTVAPRADVIPVVIAAALIRLVRTLFLVLLGGAAAFSLTNAVSTAFKGKATDTVRNTARSTVQPFAHALTLRAAQALVGEARQSATSDDAVLAAMTRRAEAAEAEAARLAALVDELQRK